jgi:hypothetical protein
MEGFTMRVIMPIVGVLFAICFGIAITMPTTTKVPDFKSAPTAFCTGYREALAAAHANDPKQYYHVEGLDTICPP